jgi:hypothetical protein
MQVRASQVRKVEFRLGEVRASKLCMAQVGTNKIGPYQHGFA